MDRSRIEPSERAEAIAALPGWREVEGRDAIIRNFRFRNFNAAFGFMTRAALVAERMNHHPEWSNVYNRVDVVLTTHDAGGVTRLDLELARIMNEIAGAEGATG